MQKISAEERVILQRQYKKYPLILKFSLWIEHHTIAVGDYLIDKKIGAITWLGLVETFLIIFGYSIFILFCLILLILGYVLYFIFDLLQKMTTRIVREGMELPAKKEAK